MIRADKYLVQQGFFESRNRALDAIKRGKVFIDGKQAKPATPCNEKSQIDIDQEKFYVSRAAKKLAFFLEEYPMDLSGKNALDIGSSTGGFVQILLENRVSSVCAVDVGVAQLHHSLREDPRIELFEETDIRTFIHPKPFDLVTCDVSFISILQILDDIDRLACDDIIILFKPQFEVGRGVKRDSKGVVVDQDAIDHAQTKFESETKRLNWKLCHHAPSKLSGKSGNIEILYHFSKA